MANRPRFRGPTPRKVTAGTLLAVAMVALMSYAAVAANQHAGDWMIFASEDSQISDPANNEEHFDATGNENLYDGDIHSNGDASVSGNDNTFTGKLEYYDEFEDTGNGNSYIADQPDQSDPISSWPGNLDSFDPPECTVTDSGDIDIKADDPD